MLSLYRHVTKAIRAIGPVLLCMLVIDSMSTRAQAIPVDRGLGQCRLDVWGERDGLPSDTIMGITQTPDGFIWLATHAGLARFDGSSFQVFDKRNTRGFTSNDISAVSVSGGQLWVGTDRDGFGPFVDGAYRPVWPDVRHWCQPLQMRVDGDGSMLVSLHEGDSKAPSLYIIKSGVVASLPVSDIISGTIPVDGGWIYASAGDGLKFVTVDGKVRHYLPNSMLPSTLLTCITRDDTGTIWCGTEHDGVFKVDRTGKVVAYRTANGLPSDEILCLYKDRAGRIWVGTDNGIASFDGDGFTVFGKIDGLYASDVRAIFEDHEGSLWVASGSGLNRFASTTLSPYTLSQGTTVATINSAALDRAGRLWCATDRGLWRMAPGRPKAFGVADGVPADSAICVCPAVDGTLWLWTKNSLGQSVAHHLKPPSMSGGRFTSIVDADRLPHSDAFLAVADDRGITAIGHGHLYRIEDGRLAWKRNVGTDYEFTMERDPSGTIWVGSTQGLFRVRNGAAELMNDGLPAGTKVLGINASRSDHLWLCTDRGLARFQNGHSAFAGANSGLPSTNLFQALPDDNGDLWVGGEEGIFSLHIADFDQFVAHRISAMSCRTFSSLDGIRSAPIQYRGLRTLDGRFWFVGNHGMTVVDPKHVDRNSVQPPVSIESATVDRTTLSLHGVTAVPPGPGTFHIAYAGLSFAAPEQVRFRYTLEGFDSGWTMVTGRRSVDYTNLPPGMYRFVVIASNNDHVWNPTGASVIFRIEPHYYQTVWFKSLLAAAVFALFAFAYLWRIRLVMRRNHELERQVADRTEQLRRSFDQLQDAQAELTARNVDLEMAKDLLEMRVVERTQELADAYDRTIEGWSRVLDLRDKETEGHSQRVTEVTVRLGREIGMSDEELTLVRRGALLHDIGKVGIPDRILLKAGPLDEDEWVIMKMHPVYAFDILSEIKFLRSSIDIPWCHHEKWDGTGYPRGLKGEEIPLPARLFSIVDVWDALHSDRPYRKAWPDAKIYDYLKSLSGTHFDPQIVDLFFRVMSEQERRAA